MIASSFILARTTDATQPIRSSVKNSSGCMTNSRLAMCEGGCVGVVGGSGHAYQTDSHHFPHHARGPSSAAFWEWCNRSIGAGVDWSADEQRCSLRAACCKPCSPCYRWLHLHQGLLSQDGTLVETLRLRTPRTTHTWPASSPSRARAAPALSCSIHLREF